MSGAASSKQRATRARPTGPRALSGSAQARRHTALILEALCGARTTQEAADAMGIALARYYVLETRALAGFIAALEPRRRGRQVTPERELDKAREEVARLERELRRYQALYRTSQRALGVAALPAKRKTKSTTKTRRRRKKPRAAAVVASLTADTAPDTTADTSEGGES